MGGLRDQTKVNIRERAGGRKQKARHKPRIGFLAFGDHTRAELGAEASS